MVFSYLDDVYVAVPGREGEKAMDLVVGTLMRILGNSTIDKILDAVEKDEDKFYSALPDPEFGREMEGISAATGIRPAKIFIFNIFYTIFGACTSIVAQNADGTM